MTDKDPTPYPSVIVTSSGAPEGSVYVHDQNSGMTVVAENSEAGYCQAITDLKKFQ